MIELLKNLFKRKPVSYVPDEQLSQINKDLDDLAGTYRGMVGHLFEYQPAGSYKQIAIELSDAAFKLKIVGCESETWFSLKLHPTQGDAADLKRHRDVIDQLNVTARVLNDRLEDLLHQQLQQNRSDRDRSER